MLLSPGVTNDGNFGLVSYRGISGLYNNNMVDGVDNNQAFFSEARGRTRASYSISQAVDQGVPGRRQQLLGRVRPRRRRHGERGHQVGHQRDVAARRFYFLRDNAFQARDPFIAEPFWDELEERRQQFGAGVGGPIKRDKVFFFVNYDQQLRELPAVRAAPSSASFFDRPARRRRPTAPRRARSSDRCSSVPMPARGEQPDRPRQGRLGHQHRPTTLSISTTGTAGTRRTASRRRPSSSSPSPPTAPTSSRPTSRVINWNSRLQPATAQRVAHPDRPRLRAADAERRRPEHVGHRRHQLRHAELPAAAEVPVRAALPVPRQRHVLPRRAHAQGRHRHQLRARGAIRTCSRAAACTATRACTTIAHGLPGRSGRLRARSPTPTPARHYTSYTQAFDLNGLGGALGVPRARPTTFFVQDTWRPTDRLAAEPRPALRVPGSCRSRAKSTTEGVTFTGNPAFPQTTSFNQDKNNWAPRLGVTYDLGGDHRHGAAGRVRPLLRPHQQQRRRQRAHQQRRQPGDVLLHADAQPARRSIRTC